MLKCIVNVLLAASIVVLMPALGLEEPAAAIWGTPDKVPAATLLVPFFEVGIDVAVNPHDTLPVVFNGDEDDVIIHWEVWNIDGERTQSLFGNVAIRDGASWSGSLRNLIGTQASPEDLDLLRDGAFYRGFMTIDLVSRSTSSSPHSDGYPFAFDNVLSGMIYYARFLEGSSNALSMVPIEALPTSFLPTDFAIFDGFYDDNNGLREEIDANARLCASARLADIACSGEILDDSIKRIHARVARRDEDETDTRVIVFAWNSKRPTQGGPSRICEELGCEERYTVRRTIETGNALFNGSIRLDHVVNIVRPPQLPQSAFGDYQIFNVIDPTQSTQIYAFAMQSAKPPEFPGFNWDAIFEAMIEP